jgi:hypothetical protein
MNKSSLNNTKESTAENSKESLEDSKEDFNLSIEDDTNVLNEMEPSFTTDKSEA